MKINFHYHFYSRILISLLIFAFGFFLLQKSVDTKALIENTYTDQTPIVGWAWNEKMGWIALNCANDFDGDGLPDGDYNAGTGSCAANFVDAGVTKWGLKMAQIDSSNYVQGCAWAGSTAESGASSSTPGWICFSDPGNTAASKDGVLMSQSTVDQTVCSCSVKQGLCEGPLRNNLCSISDHDLCVGTAPNKHCKVNSGTSCSVDADCPIIQYCSIDYNHDKCIGTEPDKKCMLDPNVSCSVDSDCWNSCSSTSDCRLETTPNCSAYTDCSDIYGTQVTNFCQADHTCALSKNTCVSNDDCQFACRNDSLPEFLPKGVCYNPAQSSIQDDIFDAHRGDKPPFTNLLSDLRDADQDATICYINKNCTVGECIYPQYGLVAGGGKGECKTHTGSSMGRTCVYDFDCKEAPTYDQYCSLSLDNNVPNAPSSCEDTVNLCIGAYEQVSRTIVAKRYVNALTLMSSPPRTGEFASIVKMESVTTTAGYEDANKISFPINSRLSNNSLPGSSNYDVDNPNVFTGNPLRGCFNCYKEKIYKCALSGGSCSCNQDQNSCANDNCTADGDSCVVNSLAPICENCQEYFYYTSNTNTCLLQPYITCSIPNTRSNCNEGDTCVSRAPGELQKVLTGFNCTDCTIESLSNSCSLNASNINNNRCNKCEENLASGKESTVYRTGGLLYDNQHGRASTSTLCGWAYNGWRDSSDYRGFGWFNFSPLISTSTKPYFSVEKGNIYSKGRIATRYQPPISKYNASYLIESGGNITNFVSQVSKTERYQGELENRPIIDFLTPLAGKFNNALGKLDYTGLITEAKDVSGVKYNKYGAVVNRLTRDEFENNIATIFQNPLNNQVFYVERDNNSTYVQINDFIPDLVAQVGNTSYPSGAGIIIVDGNLKIEKNITYSSSEAITNLKQIPSLVWIVKGDVEIDAGVTDLAGTFIILGDDVHNCSAIDPQSKDVITPPQPRIEKSYQGCGEFLSVHYNTSTWNYQNLSSASFLKVSGNVLARKFVLVRNAVDSTNGTPAEQFINDGRLQSNPPLGLTDMSKVIPRFSSY